MARSKLPLHIRVRITSGPDYAEVVCDTDDKPAGEPGDRKEYGTRNALTIISKFLASHIPPDAVGFNPAAIRDIYNSVTVSLSNNNGYATRRYHYTVNDVPHAAFFELRRPGAVAPLDPRIGDASIADLHATVEKKKRDPDDPLAFLGVPNSKEVWAEMQRKDAESEAGKTAPMPQANTPAQPIQIDPDTPPEFEGGWAIDPNDADAW